MIIAPCPKCGTLKCSMRLMKYEAHPKANKKLDGLWPCEFTPEREKILDDLAMEPWSIFDDLSGKQRELAEAEMRSALDKWRKIGG